uniref:HAT C-terminal dimerisation domain-containing protein n=1 Tax=Kryptolebias marmoratus TaxID=37003 RepID=A0A3Q3G864_KRYMA
KIPSTKRSNIKRRKKACQELLCRVQASQQQHRVWTRQGDWNSAISAGSVATVRNGKPLTDGEYAKTFMLDVTYELFDDFSDKDKIIKQIKDMPLLEKTVHNRTIMMAIQVEETQVKDINAAPFFSLALDESTDVSQVSQFSVIARYVAGDTLREQSLAVLPMKGTTRGEDLFKGFVAFHCILHHEALCAQMCGEQLGEVMSLVIQVVNFIVAQALNDRQFKTLLDEVGNSYPGLLLHSNCMSEIQTFLEMKNIEHPELANTEWLLKVFYLVDMSEHLNQLNVTMQDVGNTVLSLQQAVSAFENKLELFIVDIKTGRLLHFEKLREFKDSCAASDLQQLAGFTFDLLQSFKAHFGEFHEHTRLFKFITHSHKCTVDKANLSYLPGVSIRDFEVEVADLMASDMWVNKFKTLNEDLERLARQQAELVSEHKWTEMNKPQHADQLTVKTWNALPVTYRTLLRVSIAVLTMFGSTYACEQSFSHLKKIKTMVTRHPRFPGTVPVLDDLSPAKAVPGNVPDFVQALQIYITDC